MSVPTNLSPYEEYSFDVATHSIDGLCLSTRTTNALINNDITSIAKLLALSDSELKELRGLGKIGRDEIQDKLTSLTKEDLEGLGVVSDNNTQSITRHIQVNDSIASTPIEDVYFSTRTYNALLNNGISVIGDLSKYTHDDLYASFQGLGRAGVLEIEAYLRQDHTKPAEYIEFHEFMLKNIKENQRMIFDSYYGLTDISHKTTLESVASEFNLTRERVRQINKAVLVKVAKAIRSKLINPNIEVVILEHVNSPIQVLPELSDVYHKYGVLRVYVDSKILDTTIYKNDRLKSEWIVDSGFDMDYQLGKALDALKAQIGPVRINELASEYSVDVKILYDIKNTTISDDLIVLNTNKRATGNDFIWMIENFMDRMVRPVTVKEIAQELSVPVSVTRGLVWRVPGAVNVGLSTYALKKYGYSNKTTAEIAEGFLIAEGQPAHIHKIISYVTKYRQVNESSVPAAMAASPDVFTKLDDGYYALAQWGYEPAIATKKRLEVSAKDAVLSTLSKSEPMTVNEVLAAVVSKYGDKSTNKAVTVSSVLISLHNKGVVTRLGTDRSPFYLMRSDYNHGDD